MNARDILIYLAIINNGDVMKVLRDINQRNGDYDEAVIKATNARLKCNVLTYLDQDYPDYIKSLYRPPIVLFYYGDISLLQCREKIIGVVGSRDCLDYTKEYETKIVKDLAKDFIIISGLARGVDSIAHKAAIEAGGKTIAILGSGIENCYPAENRELYEEIKKNHLVISEYPFDSAPMPENFPFRNRIIAHLSRVLFVPEGKHKSGTSITVGFASNSCDFVACLPQRADGDFLNNELIKRGAILCDQATDITDEFESRKPKNFFQSH